MTRMFWFCYITSFLVMVVFFIFFVIGIMDKSVSSFNITTWVTILLIGFGVLLGAYLLYKAQRPGLAITFLFIPTLFGVIALLYILVIVFLGNKNMWR